MHFENDTALSNNEILKALTHMATRTKCSREATCNDSGEKAAQKLTTFCQRFWALLRYQGRKVSSAVAHGQDLLTSSDVEQGRQRGLSVLGPA